MKRRDSRFQPGMSPITLGLEKVLDFGQSQDDRC